MLNYIIKDIEVSFDESDKQNSDEEISDGDVYNEKSRLRKILV